MKRVIAVALMVMVVVGTGGAYLVLRRPAPREPVEVMIEPGSSTVAIAELLQDEDIIGSVFGFRVMAKVRGLDGQIRAGRYELRREMGVHAALDGLAAGPHERTSSVTIPEGYHLEEIAAVVGKSTHITADEFMEAVRSGDVRSEIQPPEIDNLEGLLFPETYLVSEHEDATGLLRRMVQEMDGRVAAIDWSGVRERGLSVYEGVIVASLVEREARVPEDRAKVAAVIYNRLEIGMRLQIDITALYGTDHKVPTRRDLERESPYNTYLIDGLPPTPIASSGLRALEAAADPADIDAIYYVVVESSGKHAFTSSYSEFQRLKERRPPEVRGG